MIGVRWACAVLFFPALPERTRWLHGLDCHRLSMQARHLTGENRWTCRDWATEFSPQKRPIPALRILHPRNFLLTSIAVAPLADFTPSPSLIRPYSIASEIRVLRSQYANRSNKPRESPYLTSQQTHRYSHCYSFNSGLSDFDRTWDRKTTN